jgi:hypothetical protein
MRLSQEELEWIFNVSGKICREEAVSKTKEKIGG